MKPNLVELDPSLKYFKSIQIHLTVALLLKHASHKISLTQQKEGTVIWFSTSVPQGSL